MYKCNLRGKFGQIESLFHCRITSANNKDMTVTEEKSIAGRTGGYTFTTITAFRFYAEPFGICSSSNDK